MPLPHPALSLSSRGPHCIQVIPVQGRVTSLSLSHDQLHLLSCSRDNTLKVIDLRINNIRQVFRYWPGSVEPLCARPWGALPGSSSSLGPAEVLASSHIWRRTGTLEAACILTPALFCPQGGWLQVQL